MAKNLTYAHGNTLILRADATTALNPSGAGRDSVRIRSVKTYTTHVSVYVFFSSASSYPLLTGALHSFDIRHMPQGCGTWPAAWETNEAIWPNGGEVDVVSSTLFF